MGRRFGRKKTKKVKVEAGRARMVACGTRIKGIETRKIDHNAFLKKDRAAPDNVIQFPLAGMPENDRIG